MPMPLPLHGASMLHVENECFPIKDIFRNSAKRIYPFEIKKVRRITSFSGNELATVPIAVVCIALPIRVTLTDAKIRNGIEFIYFCVQFYPIK